MKSPNSTSDREINLGDPTEVAYWTKRLGIPKRTLREIVKKVGILPSAVQVELKQQRLQSEFVDLEKEEAELQRMMEIDRKAKEDFDQMRKARLADGDV